MVQQYPGGENTSYYLEYLIENKDIEGAIRLIQARCQTDPYFIASSPSYLQLLVSNKKKNLAIELWRKAIPDAAGIETLIKWYRDGKTGQNPIYGSSHYFEILFPSVLRDNKIKLREAALEGYQKLLDRKKRFCCI